MSKSDLSVRYGASLIIDGTVDDTSATTGNFYAGNAGQVPLIDKTFNITNGSFVIELEPADTAIPLGTYNYQVNVNYPDGVVSKFPDSVKNGALFPKITILEALDETEVS